MFGLVLSLWRLPPKFKLLTPRLPFPAACTPPPLRWIDWSPDVALLILDQRSLKRPPPPHPPNRLRLAFVPSNVNVQLSPHKRLQKPHLIYHPTSNCVAISSVAMLIFPNNWEWTGLWLAGSCLWCRFFFFFWGLGIPRPFLDDLRLICRLALLVWAGAFNGLHGQRTWEPSRSVWCVCMNVCVPVCGRAGRVGVGQPSCFHRGWGRVGYLIPPLCFVRLCWGDGIAPPR